MIANLQLRPEQEIIFDFLRLDGSQADPIRKRIHQGINWQVLQEESLKQGILPLVYVRMKQMVEDLIPKMVLETWKSLYLINAEHNLRLAQQLIRVLDLLSSQGIKAIPFKGPILAEQGQGDLSLRQFSDLDLFIPHQNSSMAFEVLSEAGFLPDFLLSEKMKHYLIRTRKDLWIKKGNIQLDLHQQVPEGPASFALKEILWEDIGSIQLLNRRIPVLSLENSLLVLCLHGSEDGWDSLNKVMDLAFLIQTNPDLNWRALFSRAEEVRMVKILGLGLCLVRIISGLKMPQEIHPLIEGDYEGERLAGRIIQRMFSDTKDSFTMTLMPRSMDSFIDQIRYVGYFAFTPRTRDLINHPLPDLLFPLYYLIHPVRMIVNHRAFLFRPLFKKKK